MVTEKSKFFKVYIYLSLFLIILLLASLVGTIIYASYKVKNETAIVTNNVNNKVDSFYKSVNVVNQNLQSINTQLEKQNAQATKTLSATGL